MVYEGTGTHSKTKYLTVNKKWKLIFIELKIYSFQFEVYNVFQQMRLFSSRQRGIRKIVIVFGNKWLGINERKPIFILKIPFPYIAWSWIWRNYSSPASRLLPIQTVLHPGRLESRTSNRSFRFVSHPLQLPSPTDTRSLFHKLLIYFHVWKPVARFFEEIIGFDKEMAGVTARTWCRRSAASHYKMSLERSHLRCTSI